MVSDRTDLDTGGLEENPAIEPAMRLYKRRYIALIILSSLEFLQCLQWNTWGPISKSAIKVLDGWDSGTVALLGGWGCLTYVLFVLPMCYLCQRKGLRAVILACSFLVAVGTVFRCFSIATPLFTVLCHMSAIAIGIAGTALLSAPPLFAAQWFPPHERTTATEAIVSAVCQAFNQLGNAGSYLQALLVSDPSEASTAVIKEQIETLMFSGAIVMCCVFGVILVWFPAKPPSPPSVSSTVERYRLWPALKHIFRKKDFVLILLSYSILTGFPSAWMAVLNFSLLSLGMNQTEAMRVGIMGVLVACVAVVLVGRLTDRFYGHVRKCIVVLTGLSFLSFLWVLLLSTNVLPVTKWQVWASVIGGISFSYALNPLFFELAVEMAYPSPEDLVGGVLSAGNNVVGSILLLLYLFPSKDYIWVTYCLVGGSVISLLPFLMIVERYQRSALDGRRLHVSTPRSGPAYQSI